jgi:hypothetical protein
MGTPPPLPGVLGKFLFLIGLETVVWRKCLVLRSLDTKIFNTENVFGGVRGAKPDKMPQRIHRECSTSG